MKKRHSYYLLVMFLCLAATVSCKKGPVTPPHVNTFSASINGSAFVAARIEVIVVPTSVPGVRGVAISVLDGDSYKIYLPLHEYDGVKATFNFDNSTLWLAFYNKRDFVGGGYSYSKSGKINIASFDKTNYKPGEVITGTFQFETDDSGGKYSITNGHFSLLIPN